MLSSRNFTLKQKSLLDNHGFKIGNEESYTVTINEQLNEMFGAITGDRNPVHFDDNRMKNTRYKGRIANGIQTVSTIGTAIVKMFTTENTMPIAIEQHNSFIRPVFIGDTISATITIESIIHEKNQVWLNSLVRNQNDQVVLSARFRLKILES